MQQIYVWIQSGEHILKKSKNNKPEEGLVQVLRVTEKQYSKMEYIVVEDHSQVLNNDERLVIL